MVLNGGIYLAVGVSESTSCLAAVSRGIGRKGRKWEWGIELDNMGDTRGFTYLQRRIYIAELAQLKLI